MYDYRATGGKGKEGRGGSDPAQSISAPNFANLEEQAYQASKPYYEALVKESRGDFNRAKAVLEEDYTQGTRQAREDWARKTSQEEQDLKSSLQNLGISNLTEQGDKLDELNKRGMAVGEMQNGQYNVLSPSTIVTSNNSDYGSVANPANMGVGQGGVELDRLQQQQALRQEAVQRTRNRNVQQLGINLQRYTNLPDGVTDPSAAGVDRSQLGSAELAKVRGTEDLTRQQQTNEQNFAEQRRKDAFSTASTLAGAQTNSIPTSIQNRYLNSARQDFVNSGI